MPKENIKRAIDKSSAYNDLNYENLRYEGFGPNKIAVIVETLTDNKNRTASNLRTIFQKHGGGLGTQGSASHNFLQLGVIKIDKEEIDEENVFNLATDAGANDCIFHKDYYEIHTNKDESNKAREKICESSVWVRDVLPRPSVSMNNTVNPSGSRTGSPHRHKPLVQAFTLAPPWKPVFSLSQVAPDN